MSWKIIKGTGPLVITAIHAGHALRPAVLKCTALDEETRLREEDPYTERWTDIAPNRILVEASRFEIDLNRPVHKAVYLQPEDAWGLTVWNAPLTAEILRESYEKWEQFYNEVGEFLDEVHAECGNFAVLDIHSYCHRRGGPTAPPDDPQYNPVIDVGTGSVNTDRWSGLISRFVEDLSAFNWGGNSLDVGENVKFQGGHFSRWINQRYGENACAIAIEFKKIFMDEWTGELDEQTLELLKSALASTLPGLIAGLAK